MIFDRTEAPTKLFFVTGNRHKVQEAREVFDEAGLDIPLEQAAIDAPELQADRPAEVAEFSAREVRREFRGAFFLEDAALSIDALSGFPGVYSSYVFETLGLDGVLGLMEDVAQGDRTAHFESCIALSLRESKPKLFLGRIDGTILDEPRPGREFGYDPIFAPEGDDRAFSEIDVETKNEISHRGQALAQLVDHLGGL